MTIEKTCQVCKGTFIARQRRATCCSQKCRWVRFYAKRKKPKVRGFVAIDGRKVCARCRTEKNVGQFGKAHHSKDGLRSSCRACRVIESKAERLKMTDADRARRNAANRRRWTANIEKLRAYHRRKALEYYRRDLKRARAKGRADAKKFKARNPKAAKAIAARCARKRRAQMFGVPTARVNYERIRVRDRMTCHICKTKVRKDQLEFDHVIPLSKGGAHCEENIAVSHAACNRKKSATVLTLF